MNSTQSTPNIIYTFWEPNDHLTPYLELCMKTWEINLPDYEIITLDYSNVFDYIDKYSLNLSVIKKLPLPLQKDAIMVAVLQKHGGIFIDADTIILQDISPVIENLRNSEIILFSTHLAFMAAQAEAKILSLWLLGIQEKLVDLQKTNNFNDLNWDYIGNSVLRDVMDAMISATPLRGLTLNYQCGTLCKLFFQAISWQDSRIVDDMSRLNNTFIVKRRTLYFRTCFNKFLKMLNRDKYEFIKEAVYFKNRDMTAPEKYLKFWFESDLHVQDVISNRSLVIGLHNSWTPDWYKELSKSDILENDCLLSKTLSHILCTKKADRT